MYEKYSLTHANIDWIFPNFNCCAFFFVPVYFLNLPFCLARCVSWAAIYKYRNPQGQHTWKALHPTHPLQVTSSALFFLWFMYCGKRRILPPNFPYTDNKYSKYTRRLRTSYQTTWTVVLTASSWSVWPNRLLSRASELHADYQARPLTKDNRKKKEISKAWSKSACLLYNRFSFYQRIIICRVHTKQEG